MSTISDNRPAAQNPGDNSQICDIKVSCAQCTNAMNDKLAALKNEMKQQRKKIVYWFIATMVAITAVLVASMSFPRQPQCHHTYLPRIALPQAGDWKWLWLESRLM